MQKLLEYIKSDKGIALFSVLSLLVMLPHSAAVFYSLSRLGVEWFMILQAVLFAVSVDGAVLIFVLRGKTKHSVGFTIFQVITNVFYYWTYIEEGKTFEFGASVFLSTVLPVTLAAYSHEIAEIMRNALKEQNRIDAIEWADKAISNLREELLQEIYSTQNNTENGFSSIEPKFLALERLCNERFSESNSNTSLLGQKLSEGLQSAKNEIYTKIAENEAKLTQISGEIQATNQNTTSGLTSLQGDVKRQIEAYVSTSIKPLQEGLNQVKNQTTRLTKEEEAKKKEIEDIQRKVYNATQTLWNLKDRAPEDRKSAFTVQVTDLKV